MIFWQAVDIAPAPSLLEIVALASSINIYDTLHHYHEEPLFRFESHSSLRHIIRGRCKRWSCTLLGYGASAFSDTFYFLLKSVEKWFEWPLLLYSIVAGYLYITMSKQRKTEIKDNNISSKLLGANVSDLNIQKFRDLSQLRKQKYDLSGKINVSILKTLTNKFSPQVIFTVTLPGQGIASIEALAECTNLMVLNLSKNNIDSLAPLKNHARLRIVDLSENCIPNVDALSNCVELVNLNLEGNLIKGIDQLKALKTCTALRNLHLQTLAGNNENPICSLNQYRSNIANEFPQIKRLDCIPIAMTEFANGSEIKQSKKKDIKIDIKNIGPFYTNKFPTVPAYSAPVFAEEQGLKKSIGSCKSALQDLELKMRAMLTM